MSNAQGGIRLLKKQGLALDYLEENYAKKLPPDEDYTPVTELLYGGGAGGGKSILGCYYIIKRCLTFKGSRHAIGRKELSNLKRTTLRSFFGVCKDLGLKEGRDYTYNGKDNVIYFPAFESEVFLLSLDYQPSDPDYDYLGSLEVASIFVDEVAEITKKCKEVLMFRCRHRLRDFLVTGEETKNLKITAYDENKEPCEWYSEKFKRNMKCMSPKLLMSCNPKRGWIYDDYYARNRDGTLPDYAKFIQALPTDNKFLPESVKESYRRAAYAERQRLYYGNWDYDSDNRAMCDYDDIMAMFTNENLKTTPRGTTRISADIALKGRDRFVVGSWDGNRCRVEIAKPKSKATEVVKDIRAVAKQKRIHPWDVIYDADGIGNFVGDFVGASERNAFRGGNRPKNKKLFYNLKAECAFKLAELIKKRELHVTCTNHEKEIIEREISNCLKQKSLDADETKFRLISKEEMKNENGGKSPDFLDMMIMGMLPLVKSSSGSWDVTWNN